MQQPTIYTMLTRLDEPFRYFSLTVDELTVAAFGLMLLVFSSHKFVVGFVACALFGALKKLKKGAGPRVILVLAYWYLPRAITQLITPTLPASHQRIWIA